MTIEFRRDFNESIFLDPTDGFQKKIVTSEVRYDPLTGDISRVFPFRRLLGQRHDWTPLVEQSRQRFCPFCPEALDKATPRFLPDFSSEGHILFGDAVALPNLHPYEKYACVVVMCKEHYIPMGDINYTMIMNSFQAALEYLKTARRYDPAGASYCSINWNYMPYAGGSIIHPHLQVLAGPKPSTYTRKMHLAADEYFSKTGRNYFSQLIKIEQKNDERYLGQTGQVHWISTFAPRHIADVTGILPDKSTIWDITEQDLEHIIRGLLQVIHYYDRINLPSFNAAMYFGIDNTKGMSINLRIVGRFTILPPVGSDITFMQVLHDDPWTVLMPEKLARELKPELNKAD